MPCRRLFSSTPRLWHHRSHQLRRYFWGEFWAMFGRRLDDFLGDIRATSGRLPGDFWAMCFFC